MNLDGNGDATARPEAGRPYSGEGATERWLVMKTGPDWMLLVSREGEFRRLPLQAKPVRVGEEIDLPVMPGSATRFRFRMGWKVYAVAAAVALLALAPVLRIALVPRPSAVVAIDINPGLELELDSRSRVLRAVPKNEDGRTVLSALSLRGLDVYTAAERVVRHSQEAGFIAGDRDNLVLAAIVELGSGKRGVLVPKTNKLEEAIVSALKERGAEGFVAVSRVQPEIREAAIDEGLTVNKYIVLQKVQSMGVALSAQEVRSESVKSILDRAGLAPELMFPSGESVRTKSGEGEPSTPGAPASGMNRSQPAAPPSETSLPGAQPPASNVNEDGKEKTSNDSGSSTSGTQKESGEESQNQSQEQSRDTSSPQTPPPEISLPGTRPPTSNVQDNRIEKNGSNNESDFDQDQKEKPSGQSDGKEDREPPEVE